MLGGEAMLVFQLDDGAHMPVLSLLVPSPFYIQGTRSLGVSPRVIQLEEQPGFGLMLSSMVSVLNLNLYCLLACRNLQDVVPSQSQLCPPSFG